MKTIIVEFKKIGGYDYTYVDEKVEYNNHEALRNICETKNKEEKFKITIEKIE